MSVSENRPVRSRAALRQLWVERLQRYADSDLSVLDFCRAEGVSAQAFYYWKHKFDLPMPASAQSPRLLPVRLLAAAPAEVVLPNGIVVRLGPDCDLDFVRSLVAALGESSW